MTDSGTLTPPHPVAKPDVPLGLIVALACVAQFMVVLDTSIVNVALPSMRHSLGLSANAQQWVVDGYLITFGGFLLLAARASDLFGRRWVFQAGLIVFSLASLAGGLAGNGATLLVARVIQGVGAAALAPSSLSLIMASHADAHRRGRALALWGASTSAAGAVGMVLGGILTAELSWRYVLFVNVPIGVVLFVVATAALAPARRGGPRLRLDLPGALAITLGSGLLVYGVSDATADGWGSPTVIVALVIAAVLIAGFVLVEARTRQPLVRLGILASRGLRLANLILVCLGVCMTATIFFLSLYLQQVLGDSALQAGLAMVPMTVTSVIGAFLGRRLIQATGTRTVAVAGSAVTVGGLVWLSFIPAHDAYLVHVLGPLLILGMGMSFIQMPSTVSATAGVAQHEAGLASGLVNMGRQIGGAVGLAVLVTVATTIAAHATGGSPAAAVLHGYRAALVIDACVAAVAGITASALPNIGRLPSPVAAAAGEKDSSDSGLASYPNAAQP